MDFSGGAGQGRSTDLIPAGTLAFAILNVRGVPTGGGGSRYLDCELTITDDHPQYARRKVWDKIGDPFFSGNSEAYRQMGMVAISRICEAGRNAGPNNPAGYAVDNYEQLSGLRVPIHIGIEKGKDGFDDKNKVKEFLTPNPDSQSGHKHFRRLTEGKYSVSDDKQVAQQGGSGAPAGNSSGWGGGGAPSGFGNPQPQGNSSGGASNAGWGSNGSPAATGTPENASGGGAHTTSHSDPHKPSGWLEQANR